jgi:hypothetical protein
MNGTELIGWDRLRHGGLLLDTPRLKRIAEHLPEPLSPWRERELRRQAGALLDDGGNKTDFVRFVLEEICGFASPSGSWQRGSQVSAEWGRRAVTGETVKPQQLWRASNDAVLPVFIDIEVRLGVGRGRRSVSQVVSWLRGGSERLAVLTNGRQWRLIFTGLDFDAWCEWDLELWFEEGALSPQVAALRTLLAPALWTPVTSGAPSPLLEAILDSRKGQAELSAVLGERVREAVEILVQSHGDILKEQGSEIDPARIYQAAVRIVMRMVVILFAESRDLLPRENSFYYGAYGLTGLLEDLEKSGAARGGSRLARSWSAWPRILALFRLVCQGSSHEKLPVPAYGGELFAPGDAASPDGLSRALAIFENACFAREILSDREVHRILELLTRTRVKLRQGRASMWIPAPVDFSDLSSEYIGILYEGLLDFELKTVPPGDPVIFLAVGNQPALPLSRLEGMDDRAIADLLEKMKDTGQEEAGEETGEEASVDGNEDVTDTPGDGDEDDGGIGLYAAAEENSAEERIEEPGDDRHVTRTRAETWARRAVDVGNLVRRPRGALTPERRLIYEDAISRKARQLVVRVILPGEWYVVRWGGTRKGSGTFYTRPGLAVPTVQRTLRPLVYDPPVDATGQPDFAASAVAWTPRKPEEILALKVCDPACGSGTFPVAALRFLTDGLYASLHFHKRIAVDGEKAIARLIAPVSDLPEERLCQEDLPCRPEDEDFEKKTKARLRRHVVERCIYGVDLDPLAVELCRLSLWLETMDRELPFSFLDHKIKCGNSLVGAWFDQYRHYPVMAWKNREGGDKNHANGIHFEREARTKALKAFVKERLIPDLRHFLAVSHHLFAERPIEATTAHAAAHAVFSRLHDLPVNSSAERARIYREEILGSPDWQLLKSALDLWCACWFWPADALDSAPLPTTFHDPSPETRSLAGRIVQAKRFFHWELEFPDVFCVQNSGFDAILGNPPWDIAKPNSKEFFSNIDPLYRAYGKQEALRHQTGYFETGEIEQNWLDYNADFRAQSNFMSYAASPYGDPKENEASSDRFAVARGRDNALLHAHWRKIRSQSRGFADPVHPFGHQGSADINLYKAFLEQAHALLRPDGRLGFIVPSGLYSDHGTGGLRRLFLDQCRWEWLFGFENRDKVFEIDSRFKFNPIIIQKGGATEAISTAFMRRKLEDWEHAETFATPYSRTQVARFSPRSLAILEIQSQRDLEILEKIYANSVLLGDDSPDGWGIRYATEFHMTNDSRLFPPRPRWEAQGYRPDEYSRWLKGDWRPIEELWAELGIDPSRPLPAEIELEDWLFNTSASLEKRTAQTCHIHGHWLKPGDVQRTSWRVRCAQPPYDALPIPRADIPQGIILSREADAWIREAQVEDTALPLYEGRMIGQFDFSQKGWVSGKGRTAVWRDISWEHKQIEPQYMLSLEKWQELELLAYLQEFAKIYSREEAEWEAERLRDPVNFTQWWWPSRRKVTFIDVTSATNTRTMFSCTVAEVPCGNSAPILRSATPLLLATILNSFAYDSVSRFRCGGLHLNWFVIDESALPDQSPESDKSLKGIALILNAPTERMAEFWIEPEQTISGAWKANWALSEAERFRLRCVADVLIANRYGLSSGDLRHILYGCDHPLPIAIGNNPKGFWRVDKDKDPELRHTVLTLIAFHDLEEKSRACGGNREEGIKLFLNQNDGKGWMLPETLCLADYGLGHDDRARCPQPVASRLGPRFYDWQLAQSPEESWRECHLHARNLLGETGYQQLLDDINFPGSEQKLLKGPEQPTTADLGRMKQGELFD